MNYYISPTIRTEIEKHIFGNMLIEKTKSPLILGIFGPTGEGKTFQLNQVLANLGVFTVDIGASELENENSGFPAGMLRTEYIKASNSGKPTAIIINDIDAAIGKWDDLTQYTVNRQNVTVQLMHFCENPYDVAGHSTKRIPIFVTGNNLNSIYGPLKRPGRMRTIEWVPTIEEKIKIVSRIFPQIDSRKIGELVKMCSNFPVSFWSDVEAELQEENVYFYFLENYSSKEIRHLIAQQHQFSLNNMTITYEELLKKVRTRKDISRKTYLD